MSQSPTYNYSTPPPPPLGRKSSPASKRFKTAHPFDHAASNASTLWERLDDQSPRTRRMGRMAFSGPMSSPGASSSSPARTADDSTMPSSPTVMPSSPLVSEASWSYSKKRKASEAYLTADETEADDIEEIDGLQLLLTAIERQQPNVFKAVPTVRPSKKIDIKEEPKTPGLGCIEICTEPTTEDYHAPSEDVFSSLSPLSSDLGMPSGPTTPKRTTRTPPALDQIPTSSKSPTILGTSFDIPSSPLSAAPSPLSSPAKPVFEKDDDKPALSTQTLSPPKPTPPTLTPEQSELIGLIISALALGTTTSLTAVDIADAVSKEAPHLLKVSRVLTDSGNTSTTTTESKKGKAKAAPKKSAKAAKRDKLKELVSMIEEVLASGAMFGRVDRKGEDAAGDPLLPSYHYEPDQDPDQDRAMTIRAVGMRSRRRATKHHVQYHYAPISMNRFELAAECGEDE